MDKIERLISIVMILLQRDVVSATEFSQLLNVSKRTILRDMETISLSSIPVYSISGVNGGFGIMNEYKLDKRLLTNNDLMYVLTALQGLGQILVKKEVEITEKKLASMVCATAMKNPLHLSFYDWAGRSEILQLMKTCMDAISLNRLLSFDYMNRDGTVTKRNVEPYQLRFSETSWYLRAFCLSRMEYRTFKLSRTDSLKMEITPFTPRENALQAEMDKEYSPQLVEIKALISPKIKDHFVERYGRNSIESGSAEALVATIYLPHNEIGYQFLASFGTNLKVIEPKSYAEDYKAFINSIIGIYSD